MTLSKAELERRRAILANHVAAKRARRATPMKVPRMQQLEKHKVVEPQLDKYQAFANEFKSFNPFDKMAEKTVVKEKVIEQEEDVIEEEEVIEEVDNEYVFDDILPSYIPSVFDDDSDEW